MKVLIPGLAIALVILGFSNPKLNENETKALNSIQDATIVPHLKFLADDYLEGRSSGERGNEIAARYIAAQFQRMGLEPAGENGTYFQSVKLVEKKVAVESGLQLMNSQLNYISDFYTLGGPANLNAELVFAGYGITAPEYNYNDFDGLDVTGKIVVFMTGEPVSTDSSYFLGMVDSPHASSRVKAKKIEAMGAAGVIQLLMPSEEDDFSKYESWFTHPQVSLAGGKTSGPSFVRIIMTARGSDRFLTLFGLKRDDLLKNSSAGKIISTKKIKAQLDLKHIERAFTSPNVLAILPGSDPKLKNEAVILTAHFDHVGIGKAVDGDSIYNGLSDNASGTGVLMSVGEAFTKLQGETKRSVIFLACTAEEMGLLGSKYFTDNPTFPIENIVADINMDVMGFASEESKRMVTFTGQEYTTLGETMSKWAAYLNMQVMPDIFPEERFFFRSDNLNFHLKKVPSISPGSGMKDRALFDEYLKYYHQPSDQWGKLPLNVEALRLQAQVIFLSALDVANAPTRPQFKNQP